MLAFNQLASKQDVPKTNAHVCQFRRTFVNKYLSYFTETKSLHTVKGHTDGHRET